MDEFLAQAGALDDKLAVLLVQLPPKLELDAATAGTFFRDLANGTSAQIACEPRNATWFTGEADALLDELGVARVAADPALTAKATVPGGWRGLSYWRLHGSPVIYRSSYADRIADIAQQLDSHPAADTWCIFDNTASSAGAGDARALMKAVGRL